MNPVELGLALRRLRLRGGLTQAQLARRMKTSQPAIARAEAGSVQPSLEFVDRYARGVGVPLTLTFGAKPSADAADLKARADRVFGPGFEQNPWARNPSAAEAEALEARGKGRGRFSRDRNSR